MTPGAILCLSGLGSDIGFLALKSFFKKIAKISWIEHQHDEGKVTCDLIFHSLIINVIKKTVFFFCQSAKCLVKDPV